MSYFLMFIRKWSLNIKYITCCNDKVVNQVIFHRAGAAAEGGQGGGRSPPNIPVEGASPPQ